MQKYHWEKVRRSQEAVMLRNCAVAWTSYRGIDGSADRDLMDAALKFTVLYRKSIRKKSHAKRRTTHR